MRRGYVPRNRLRDLAQRNFQRRSRSVSSFTVGLPRSGTNFFQQLFSSVTSESISSMYSGMSSSNVKTHAISPDYLKREIELFKLHCSDAPRHFVILRDPRDVAISFFDFFLARNQADVGQSGFLDVDWFLAFSRGTAKTDLRSHFIKPTSIEQAFREFANNWVAGHPAPNLSAVRVRYEKLTSPESLPEELLAAGLMPPSPGNLGLQARLGAAHRKLVSQYSKVTTRPRGRAFMFRDAQVAEAFKPLIRSVEDRLGDVIESMGYN